MTRLDSMVAGAFRTAPGYSSSSSSSVSFIINRCTCLPKFREPPEQISKPEEGLWELLIYSHAEQQCGQAGDLLLTAGGRSRGGLVGTVTSIPATA